MPNSPQRKSPRLADYRYTLPGAYFVTICTHQRQFLFGDVTDDSIRLSSLGEITHRRLQSLPDHYPSLSMDDFVVMPNHVHAILILHEDPEHHPNLSDIVGNHKGGVTRSARRDLDNFPSVIWQRSYHDHIIRGEEVFSRIREYVQTNPQRWRQDKFYSP